MRAFVIALVAVVFCMGVSTAYVVPDDFVKDARIIDSLTKAFIDYNLELDYNSGQMALTSGPLSLMNATAVAPGGAVYQRIVNLYTKYCDANVTQQDRVWDNVAGNPYAAIYPTGVARGQGIQQIAGALTNYLLQAKYHGQNQYFGPLRISQLSENTYRIWTTVHTVVHRRNALAPKGLLRIDYYGEKVHEYVRIPAADKKRESTTNGKAGDKYLITKVDNGMRHDFITAPAARINLPAPYDLVPIFNDITVEQSSVLCEPIFPWETNNA